MWTTWKSSEGDPLSQSLLCDSGGGSRKKKNKLGDVTTAVLVLSVQLDAAAGGRLAADQCGAPSVHGNLQKTPAGWKGPTQVVKL